VTDLGEPFAEDDGELSACQAPVMWRHGPLLFGAIQDQEQQFQRRIVGREVTSGAHRAAQLGIDRSIALVV
jgi:hypothetical protein